MLDKVIHGEGVPHCNGWVAYLSGTKNIPTDRRLGSDVSNGERSRTSRWADNLHGGDSLEDERDDEDRLAGDVG